MPYRYEGTKVFIPPAAEVSKAFRPNDDAPFRDIIQSVLDNLEPWEKGQDPIETFDLPTQIGARVIKLAETESPFWAVNVHHKANTPGLSPFILPPRNDPRRMTDSATLELTGTPQKPILTRVYPGEYMPPLPWMQTANKAPGGKDECIEFWMRHAFLLRRGHIRDISQQAPHWYINARSQ